ncbi:MAG: efflux RND transporter periplasmic adaptor subunit [Bacteroidetes bacterium]|nr:efflux RND transporter periplasmic adaptor subunit [Bacteroidota bacterium]
MKYNKLSIRMVKRSKVLLVGLIAVLSACGGENNESQENKVAYLPLVKMEKAEVTTFIHKIRVQGNVETDQDVLLNAEMGGQITKIFVKEGQRVTAGQTLISLDASILSSNMNEVQTQLDYAEYMLKKQEELKKRGVGSEFDLETAKNQVNSLKSKMRSINAQRGKSAIKAPFSGVIDQVFAKDGEVVGPQNPLVRLVNNSNIEITADISEKHLSSIHLGTEVEVSFPNYTDTMIKVRVSNVGNYIEPTNRTFRIQAKVPNNKILLPNMLAELSITDMFQKNAMVVPSIAIIKDQYNKDFIYKATLVSPGKFKISKIDVSVIEKYDGKAFIKVEKGFLQNGDKIVTNGAKGITEQDIVRIK